MSCESCKKYREALEKLAKMKGAWDGESYSITDWMVNKVAKEALDSLPEPVEEERTCANCENYKPGFMGRCWSCADFSEWIKRID